MLKNMFIFATGALAGTVIGARLVKKRYEEIANEEIEEIRAYYKEKEEQQKARSGKVEEKVETINSGDVSAHETSTSDIVEEKIMYNNIVDKYTTETEITEPDNTDVSYPIDPSEYGNEGHYATETLTYFADGVLVNEVDEEIEDWETTIGRHHVEVFEEFPDATTVYVRCDWERTDYEIIKDDWCWSDIQEPEKKPHQL